MPLGSIRLILPQIVTVCPGWNLTRYLNGLNSRIRNLVKLKADIQSLRRLFFFFLVLLQAKGTPRKGTPAGGWVCQSFEISQVATPFSVGLNSAVLVLQSVLVLTRGAVPETIQRRPVLLTNPQTSRLSQNAAKCKPSGFKGTEVILRGACGFFLCAYNVRVQRSVWCSQGAFAAHLVFLSRKKGV